MQGPELLIQKEQDIDMNLIVVGAQVKRAKQDLEKSGSMQKESALIGGTLAAAAIPALKALGLGAAMGAGWKYGGDALDWGYRSILGPTDEYKSKQRLLNSRRRANRRIQRLPGMAGGAGLGALAGNLLTGGSGWGTALGGTAGGYLGYNYGNEIYDAVSNWMEGSE